MKPRAPTVGTVIVPILAAAIVAASPDAGAAQRLGGDRGSVRAYTLARDGWSFERFGTDVAILRSAIGSDLGGGGPGGLIVLSCEAEESRWRLSLPGPSTSLTSMRIGWAVLHLPSAAGPFRSARVGIRNNSIFSLAEVGRVAFSFVTFFVEQLKAGTPRLDLLFGIRPTGAPATLSVIVLSPVHRAADNIAFDDFLSACRSIGP